jgi:hypothetical protein
MPAQAGIQTWPHVPGLRIPAYATKQIKCSISVMAGLVPAIHVVTLPVLQYIVTTAPEPRQNASKPFAFLELDHVDGRDNPGHDDAA